jgi:ribosomal-protein-alanine N-acetyltransferase
MNYDDLVKVAEVDSSAFRPVWRNSLDSLKIAYRQGAIATVAEKESEMVGYQISTASPMGGHLARLAVRPQYQKNGIGYALVKDALDQFKQRGALRVTVNTQKDNAVSLSLYLKAGFQSVGEEYPVYQYKINDLVAR